VLWKERLPIDNGWALYSGLEHDDMKEGRDLLIGYGTFNDPDVEDNQEVSKIGAIVFACLTLAGLECVWDGHCTGEIRVPNLPDKTEPKPGPKLSVVIGTSSDAQKSGNPNEKPAVRPELKLVINRLAATQPTHGWEAEHRTKPLFSDQPVDAIGATHNTEE
jgi:hypothetical protein